MRVSSPPGVQPPTNPYETGKLPAGMILGERYLLLSKIAQGGMGAVYEARQVPGDALHRTSSPRLAIKEMSLSILSRLHPGQQQALVESFHREFELLSRLSHPNLVQAFQFFEQHSRHFFVMEFIEGRTLETILDTLPVGQLLPLERVLAWARQLCDVLHYLHMQTPPIIYRDLKPSNVMELYPPLVDENGDLLTATAPFAVDDVKIKLFDFGIARFYKPGQKSDTVRFGTDGYLAPEIIAYQVQTSERTDVYALGALLHQVLTRFDPQMDPWKRPALRSIYPQVPEYVANAIDHALALNPANRTPSAAEFLKELFGQDARPSIDLRRLPAQPVASNSTAASGPVMAPLQPVPVAAFSPPAVSSPPAAAAPAATVALDLGGVQKGRTASGSFEVILSGGIPAPIQSPGAEMVQGNIISSSPWLKADPERFAANAVQSGAVNVHVYAKTKNLPLGRWEAAAVKNTTTGKSTVPLWFVGLQRKGIFRSFLRGWLGFHLNLFVPLPSRHRGLMQVVIPGNPEMQIQVLLEVFPPAWRSFVGWALVFGMIGFEVSLIFTLILLAVSLLVAVAL